MKKINLQFNIILFICLSINEFLMGLTRPESHDKVPLDAIYDKYPYETIVVVFIVSIMILLCLSKILEVFWKYFVSDVFKIRAIDYQESLSLSIFVMFLMY